MEKCNHSQTKKSLEIINWKLQLYDLEFFNKTKVIYSQWESKAFWAWETMGYYFNFSPYI